MTDIPSWAKVGAKVVCVDASLPNGEFWAGHEQPIVGAIYTISSVGLDRDGVNIGVNFIEIERDELARAIWGWEVGYYLHRFRPLITRTEQQDLALFTPMLERPDGARAPRPHRRTAG